MINNDLFYKYLVLIIRLLLGIIFIISRLSKSININEFAAVVKNFNLLPYKIIPYFSMFLVVFEYLVGIALIIGIYPRHSGFLSGLKKLKIQMAQSCGGYVLIADKHNICRLSIRAAPNEIIHEIVERYIDKE